MIEVWETQENLFGVTCQEETPPVQQLWPSAMARQDCRDRARLSLADPGSGSMARQDQAMGRWRLALVQHPWDEMGSWAMGG